MKRRRLVETAGIEVVGWTWEIGRRPLAWTPARPTYVLGYPAPPSG